MKIARAFPVFVNTLFCRKKPSDEQILISVLSATGLPSRSKTSMFTGFLAVGLTSVHFLVLLGDRYVGYSLDQLLVPFASVYRPLWIAFGIVAFYCLVVIALSWYIRNWIGPLAWRILHYGTYGLYLMALGHSIMCGSDTGQLWANLLYWLTFTILAGLTLWRFSDAGAKRVSEGLSPSYRYPR